MKEGMKGDEVGVKVNHPGLMEGGVVRTNPKIR